MADEVDRTAERQEREAGYLLRAARKPEGPKPSGFCLYCEMQFTDMLKRFCDAACRDDYERIKSRNRP
jgi:hypothetical protein